MLLVGLLVTMGIGSSFATIPIITTIFVPLCLHLGFSPMATIAIIGSAAAVGDAGSPASDSTLGPTSDSIWMDSITTFGVHVSRHSSFIIFRLSCSAGLRQLFYNEKGSLLIE